ncbi:hypothetical protein Msil_3392 [Methylocella silvestris BL2]|uniref:Transposase n=1 Tax=Methylocella silvestris (strain DSM 15510 / CIP 108128 / LMG 27833 / NCIMB 13906 / BL2) TaxID=395965 RepID=B8ES79_METSB|nr:hypothetical protein Msil_3392 [Methylocella silvestris BL2]
MKFALAQGEDQKMKRSCFSEEQIIGILKEHEAGVSCDLCCKHGVCISRPAARAEAVDPGVGSDFVRER